jgi:RND family efflux transporter MFP subunit
MKKTLIILVVAAIAAGAWLLFRRRAEAPGGEAKPVAQVQVAPLAVRVIVESLDAFGLVEPAPSGVTTVTLAYDVVVRKVAVSPGALVSAGDVLLEVEATPDAALALDSARGSAKLANEGLEAARQRFDLRLAARQELLAAEQAAQDAGLRLASLEGRVPAGGRLLAPEAGVVTKLDVQSGTVVAAGTALVAITGRAQLEAHLAIEAADAAKVRAGQGVALTPADRTAPAESVGTVRQVGASVDPVSGAVDVRVTLPPIGSWFAGEHVQGAIHINQKKALAAPRSAVLPDGDEQVLYTVAGNKAVRHSVKVGIAADGAVEVISADLHAGESAVVVGNYELEDGMSVEVSAEDGKADAAASNPEKTR